MNQNAGRWRLFDWFAGLFDWRRPEFGLGHGRQQLSDLPGIQQSGAPRPRWLGFWINLRSVERELAELRLACQQPAFGRGALIAVSLAAGDTPSQRRDQVMQAAKAVHAEQPELDNEQVRGEVVKRLQADGYRWGDLDVLAGFLDGQIDFLARAIAGKGIWLRLLPEIFGFSRNIIAGPDTFQQAWRYFVERVRKIAPDTRFLLHGSCDAWEDYYPGDDVVDGMAESFYETSAGAIRRYYETADWAKAHGREFMVAECAPVAVGIRPQGTWHPEVWARWFTPWSDFIAQTKPTVVFYTATNWADGSLEYANWGDTRWVGSPIEEQLNDLLRREFRTA